MTVQEISDEFTLLSHQGKAQAAVMHISGEVVKNITGIELIGDDIALIISEKTDPELKDKLLDLKANCDLAIEGRDLKIIKLERENRLLGKRCNQLLKDKGSLTDELQELKETFAQTIENDEVAYETLKLHNQEEIGMLNSKIAGLEAQLKQEAEEYAEQCYGWCNNDQVIDVAIATYITSAEPREKRIEELEKENTVLERRIERAKECMKKLLFIINSDPANYNCKGLIQDAEDFIHNQTCNIRQQGEHCISETRCIMCDKEDGKVK